MITVEKAQFQHLKKAWNARTTKINNDANVKDTGTGQIEIAELENKIEQAEDMANKPYLSKLTPEQVVVHSNDCKLISQKTEKLKAHKGQAFTTI
jgi:hypothetical protein